MPTPQEIFLAGMRQVLEWKALGVFNEASATAEAARLQRERDTAEQQQRQQYADAVTQPQAPEAPAPSIPTDDHALTPEPEPPVPQPSRQDDEEVTIVESRSDPVKPKKQAGQMSIWGAMGIKEVTIKKTRDKSSSLVTLPGVTPKEYAIPSNSRYPCNFIGCGKAFVNAGALSMHRKSCKHNPEKSSSS
jgi:hypothetical protein